MNRLPTKEKKKGFQLCSLVTFFNAQATFKALDSAGHSPLCPFRPDRLSANRHTHCRDSLWSRSQLYTLQQQQQLYCIFRFTILRSNIQSLWLQRDRSKPYSRHWPEYRTVSFVTSILYISVQISFLTSFFFPVYASSRTEILLGFSIVSSLMQRLCETVKCPVESNTNVTINQVRDKRTVLKLDQHFLNQISIFINGEYNSLSVYQVHHFL